MATLTPVEHDPFAQSSPSKLTPVDHDPFQPSDLTTPDNSWTGFGREALRSAGEGIASIGDIGPQVYTAIKNAPSYATNAGIEAAKSATPEQLKERGVDPAVVNMQPEATAPLPNFYHDAYDKVLPVTPGYEKSWTREVGNIVGPTALTLGVDSAPALIQNVAKAAPKVLADTALTTGGTVAGKEGGGAAGQYFGGDTGRQWGEALGGLFGGFTTPLAVNSGIAAGRRMWVDPVNSPMLRDQARLSGVNYDLSLVGNDSAAAAGKGRGFAPLRAEQQNEISNAQKNNAAAIRGTPSDKQIALGNIGADMQSTALDAAAKAKADADRLYNPMSEAAGRGTVVDPAPVRATISNLRGSDEVSALSNPTINNYENLLNADSNLVVDPVEEGNIQAQRAAITAQGTPLTPSAAQAQQQALDALDARQAANRGPSWNQMQAQKARGGNMMDRTQGFDLQTEGAIHGGYDEALRRRAVEVGYDQPGATYDDVEREFGHLRGDQATLTKIGESGTPSAYNKVLSPTNEQDYPLLQQLSLHANASDLSKILADNLELRGRGPLAAGRPGLPQNVGLPAGAADWWAKLPEETKALYTRTELAPNGQPMRVPDAVLRDRIEAAFNLSRADARRGGIAQADPVENFPAASMGAAGLLTGHYGMVAGSAFPRISGIAAGKLLRNRGVTDALIDGYPALTASDLARALAASVGSRSNQ